MARESPDREAAERAKTYLRTYAETQLRHALANDLMWIIEAQAGG